GTPVGDTAAVSSRCCHRHDCCYDFAQQQGCHPITDRYKWTCQDNTVICKVQPECHYFYIPYLRVAQVHTDILEVKHSALISEDAVLDRCQNIICQCDKEASQCWRFAPFNKRYIFWPNYLCGRIYPLCGYRN
ncbi:hypothetical protein E2320_005328, partial [Naja naja]